MNEQPLWIELLGTTLSGAQTPDTGLIWTNLEGWTGLPEARGDTDPIPGAHGSFKRKTILRQSRIITITGHIYATNTTELHTIRDNLETALAAGAGTMRVSSRESGVWERYVEIDTLDVDPDRGRRWTKFVVDMVAPDPRRYGPLQRVGPVGMPVAAGGVRLPQRMPWNFGTVSEASRLIVPNAGAISMAPTLEVVGGFSQVTIYEIATGRRLRFEWAVDDGDVVVFDCGARRVTVGGADMTRWLRVREWFDIPAGQVGEFRFEVVGRVGDPLLSAFFRIGAW
ncbi:phage distal tail protein [Leucobacter salsicius]|uniref:phage distal tail protein n=1 Tax=Leucobacter salsicius TaxID=664638 RepID=UPI0003499B2D|nr:phage tail domain-containing protein [Leucobacter salsicius]